MREPTTDAEAVLPRKSVPVEAPPSTDALPRRRGVVGKLVSVFHPPTPAVPIADADEVTIIYRYWRRQVLITSIVGYAIYYIVRKNISIAMPAMEADLGIRKADLGLFLTLHGLVYGVSKFFNGFLGDQANARYFMASGLLLAAGMNFMFGLSSAVVTLGIFWLLNGYFQGMGFPPCARVITHWFAPGERATVFSVWNTSHSLGAAAVLVLGGYLVVYDWRLCFFVPAAIGVVGALFIARNLPDTPAELGLPEVEHHRGERKAVAKDGLTVAEMAGAPSPSTSSEQESFRRFLWHQVFANPLVWILALANFFVYVVRYSILDWGPSFLHDARSVELRQAGWMMACFEIGGVVGMLVGGVVTDRVFKSRAGRACVLYMAFCATLVYVFWQLPVQSLMLNSALLAGIGFFIYGPQCLVGVIAANLATKRAAATAIGLTGLFGYASTILSGWGLGAIVDSHGWHIGFRVVVICAVIAAILFVWLWNVSADTELNAHS